MDVVHERAAGIDISKRALGPGDLPLPSRRRRARAFIASAYGRPARDAGETVGVESRRVCSSWR
jgi:hypothetical protein